MSAGGLAGKVGVLILAGGCCGCAFTDETVDAPWLREVATHSQRGQGREILIITPFGDSRPDRERCGMKKNTYNSDLGRVLCSRPPRYFLSDLLESDLRASGFSVVFRRTPGAAVVHGDLMQFFLEPKSNFFTTAIEADIGLLLVVETPDGFVARRRFYVKGEQATVFLSHGDHQAATDSAIRLLLLDTVGAIANLLDHHRPPPASATATLDPGVPAPEGDQ
jgi:hypothetical protein